jgi:hypothetical protein
VLFICSFFLLTSRNYKLVARTKGNRNTIRHSTITTFKAMSLHPLQSKFSFIPLGNRQFWWKNCSRPRLWKQIDSFCAINLNPKSVLDGIPTWRCIAREKWMLTLSTGCAQRPWTFRALFNDAFGIETISRRMAGRLIMNCKALGRKRSWFGSGNIPLAQSVQQLVTGWRPRGDYSLHVV